MKKIIIIHGWEGTPEHGWCPWLKRKLEKQGFVVEAPAMPNTAAPKLGEWLGHIEKLVSEPSTDYYFIGHSLGCITILRYLESLPRGKKIGGAILVAGFVSDLGFIELDSFFQTRLDWDKIKQSCEKFTAIHSDNDPFVSTHYGDFFKNNLNAKLLVEHNMKHFSGDDGIIELPVLFDEVLEISK